MRIALVVWCLLLCMSCDSGDDDGFGDRTCGDSECSQATCETQARCPEDCGACTGANCESGNAAGQCTESCSSSCDCVSQSEVCTADYGVSPGTCVPVECVLCESFEACSYSPNGDGACLNATCG